MRVIYIAYTSKIRFRLLIWIFDGYMEIITVYLTTSLAGRISNYEGLLLQRPGTRLPSIGYAPNFLRLDLMKIYRRAYCVPVPISSEYKRTTGPQHFVCVGR